MKPNLYCVRVDGGRSFVSHRPADTRPLPAATLSRARVTGPGRGNTLSHVGKTWPVEDFNIYLRALMDAEAIETYAELSRLTGVSQNQFSNWRRGLAQPSRDNLRKIAPALGLRTPVTLYIQAGLDEQDELELGSEPDFRVLPKPLLELRDVYEQMKQLGREDVVLSSVSVLVAGLKAELANETARRGAQPSGRRKRAG